MRPDRQAVDSFVDEMHLLGVQEMRQFFPNASIWRERLLGFAKSLVAAKL